MHLVSILDLPLFPGGSDGKVSACNAGDPGSIPGSGRSPGEGNGNPLQYSCLENPMDWEACWATVHGVAESDTTEWLHFHTLVSPHSSCFNFGPSSLDFLLTLVSSVSSSISMSLIWLTCCFSAIFCDMLSEFLHMLRSFFCPDR